MEEKTIVYLLKKKDINAFKMIYQKYDQSLLRTALRILKDQQDAEDAVQLTFLKLFKKSDSFSFKSKFSSYLFKILINTCYDILSKNKKLKTLSINDSNPKYSGQPELRLSLEKAIEELPDQMRVCFVLFAVEGFKQKEIAKILSLSIGGVKSNIYQAKCRLRMVLSPALKEVV